MNSFTPIHPVRNNPSQRPTVRTNGGAVSNGTRWQFYFKTDDAWRSMKEACLNAQTSIDIEQYIIEPDDVGGEFLELLIRKRKEGAHIRILCDMVGSYALYTSDLPHSLKSVGIEIRFFNIIKPWRLHNFLSWFLRDHRKLMVVDNTLGFIGGVGFRSDMKSWRDTHVKVNGPIVKEMRFAFEDMWETAGSENFFRRMRRTSRFTKGFQFLTNSPIVRRRFIYQELIHAIRTARSYIYISTPYFIPDRRLRRALRGAARRGVDVRVLIPEECNYPSINIASRTVFDHLLSSGVCIYLYENEMLHAKTAVIDDTWTTVGSFNLDSLSFFYNYEANIVSNKASFASELKTLFAHDLQNASEVSLSEWRKRSTFRKCREALWLPLRRFL